MPVKIIKVYKGTNLIKARLSGNRIKYGYRWTHEGKKYTRAQWDTKDEAQTAFSKFRLKMINPNRLDYEDVEINIDLLFAAWKERAERKLLSPKRVREIGNIIERFKSIASTDKLRRLSENDLLDYRNHRLSGDKPKHPHTVNKEIDLIRMVLRAASSLFPGFNWQPPKVEPLPQLHKGREVLLSREQLKAILTWLKEPVSESNIQRREKHTLAYDVIVIGIETAMRISEIVGLKKSQVHFERGIGFKHGFIVVNSAKTNKQEQIPMTRNVAVVLKRRADVVRGACLFKRDAQSVNPVGQRVRRALREACEALGIPYGITAGGAVFHTIRHSTTTELVVNKKVPIPTVMKITRHSSRTMVMRYTHPTNQAVEEAIEQAEIDLSDIEDNEAAGINLESRRKSSR